MFFNHTSRFQEPLHLRLQYFQQVGNMHLAIIFFIGSTALNNSFPFLDHAEASESSPPWFCPWLTSQCVVISSVQMCDARLQSFLRRAICSLPSVSLSILHLSTATQAPESSQPGSRLLMSWHCHVIPSPLEHPEANGAQVSLPTRRHSGGDGNGAHVYFEDTDSMDIPAYPGMQLLNTH